jgi:hypothetical protein
MRNAYSAGVRTPSSPVREREIECGRAEVFMLERVRTPSTTVRERERDRERERMLNH